MSRDATVASLLQLSCKDPLKIKHPDSCGGETWQQGRNVRGVRNNGGPGKPVQSVLKHTHTEHQVSLFDFFKGECVSSWYHTYSSRHWTVFSNLSG